MELLRSRRLPADHWDWRMGASFSFDREDDGPESTAGAAAAPSGDTSGAPAGEGNLEVCTSSGVV